MAQLATVNPLNQFFALDGSPLNNGKLYFGDINTDPEQNPVQMYWDAAGLVPALQPIRTTSGYPSRSGSPAILYCAVEYSLRVRQSNDVQVFYVPKIGSLGVQAFTQFQPTTVTPSFVSVDTFTVTGDQTADFQAGRRAQFEVTAGTVYGTITSSVYTSLTTVVMDMDGASVLDAGLETVNLSILTPQNTALPAPFDNDPAGLQTYVGTTTSNDIINGSFAVDHDVTRPTADNAFILDGWRLLLGAATAAVPVVETTDIPVGAAYALKLTVGAGNNNKFGAWSTIDNRDTLKYRGTVASLTVPLKATAGLVDGTGKIRIGIAEWTGTANDTLTDPISAWGAEGTNPTLAAGWAFLNTPAAISVTTAYVNYSVENITVGATANNLAVFVWSDDTTNTTTTDILRIGAGVTMVQSANAPAPRISSYEEELAKCECYTAQTFPRGVAPAQGAGVTGTLVHVSSGGAAGTQAEQFRFSHRLLGVTFTSTTYNPTTAAATWRDTTGAADVSVAITQTVEWGTFIAVTGSPAAGNILKIHVRVTARI